MAGKGDLQRPVDLEAYRANYERIFGLRSPWTLTGKELAEDLQRALAEELEEEND